MAVLWSCARNGEMEEHREETTMRPSLQMFLVPLFPMAQGHAGGRELGGCGESETRRICLSRQCQSAFFLHGVWTDM